MMLALAGALAIMSLLALILSNRLSPLAALILVPVVAGVLVGQASAVPGFMVAGVTKIAPIAGMFVFAILFFGVMTDAGLLAPLVAVLLRGVGERPARITGVNFLPWTGPTLRAAAALKVPVATLFTPMIGVQLVGLAYVFTVAWWLGRRAPVFGIARVGRRRAGYWRDSQPAPPSPPLVQRRADDHGRGDHSCGGRRADLPINPSCNEDQPR